MSKQLKQKNANGEHCKHLYFASFARLVTWHGITFNKGFNHCNLVLFPSSNSSFLLHAVKTRYQKFPV